MLVVAAMLGAVAAHVLTSVSRRLRTAAVAQLPSVIFSISTEELSHDATIEPLAVSSSSIAASLVSLADMMSDSNATAFMEHLAVRDKRSFADVKVYTTVFLNYFRQIVNCTYACGMNNTRTLLRACIRSGDGLLPKAGGGLCRRRRDRGL